MHTSSVGKSRAIDCIRKIALPDNLFNNVVSNVIPITNLSFHHAFFVCVYFVSFILLHCFGTKSSINFYFLLLTFFEINNPVRFQLKNSHIKYVTSEHYRTWFFH